jgi:glycosyltransferase involved in cell wall biosynthesis/peptidoglycan/xylan/chitin deacetylase (PgdA/CDA1 family)
LIELSVVIPTYNRVSRLKKCLEALSYQTQPFSDFEVIVVVDGSNDDTVEMLEGLSTPYTLKVLNQENKGQHIARNYGVKHARGQYCLFLDDDIVAEPQLISEHISLHKLQDGVVGIGQITITVTNPDWFTQRFAEGWKEHYNQLNKASRQPTWSDGYGGNLSVSRTIFNEIGGFAPDIRRSHDIELAYRLEQHGLKFTYLPKAIGRQVEHKKARELFEDAAKSGAAWVTLCQRHPAMLPELLGPLGSSSVREALLREFFWFCRISPQFLSRLGSFLEKTSWGNKWYRFLFIYGYWRGVRQAIPDKDTWERMVKGVPILMYHAFGKPGEPASQFVLPIQKFVKQMAWLKRLDYHVISLDEFLQCRYHHQLPPSRTVIITIDDGYTETATLAYPILRRHDFPTTIFLVSGKVGGCNDWTNDEALRGRRLLSWLQIKEMANQGVQFGAHTQTHPVLTSIPIEQARVEIYGSKAELEKELQIPVITFAYPYGEFDNLVEGLVKEAGFSVGCTIEQGLNSWSTALTSLRRFEVEGGLSLIRFLLLLRLGGHL